MADIFISYAREDTEAATRLAMELEARGWSIFWDRRIPAGQRFAEFISAQLADARCVIALWSRAANASDWVQEEAEEARKRSVLVPAFIERVDPPWGFRRIQSADLVDWTGQAVHEGFQQLLEDVGQYAPAHVPLIAKLPKTMPSEPSGTLEPEQVTQALQPSKKVEAGRETAEAQSAARETDEKEQLRAQQNGAATGAAVRLIREKAGQAKIESAGAGPDQLRQEQAEGRVRASETERVALGRVEGERRRAKQAEIQVTAGERRDRELLQSRLANATRRMCNGSTGVLRFLVSPAT